MTGPVAYRVVKRAVGPAVGRCYRLHVDGLDQVPDGPVVLAANHRSFMDSVFIAAVIHRPVHFLAKAEYFERPVSRWVFDALGQIPLRRGSGSSARHALGRATDLLAGGGLIAAYPEGTRSRDGFLHRGNQGPARLAATAAVPLVPVGLIGTHAVQAPEERLPHLFRPVTVRFGKPLEVPSGDAATRPALREVTDRLMATIATLCEQPYTDTYAA